MSLEEHLKELEICRETHNQQGVANLTFKIGDIYFKKGKWDEAIAYMREAEAICRKLRNEEGRARAAIGLGDVFRAGGNRAEARDY